MIRFTIRPILIVIFILSVSFAPALHAHLLPKQRGTLNFVDNGAYMVLSLPVSVFIDFDDNENGLLSMTEFNKHRPAITSRIRAGIVLNENGDDRFLQGLMFSPVGEDEHNTSVIAPISRVYVMGKFILDSSNSELIFSNDLYGDQASERVFKMSAKRKADRQKQVFELSPSASKKILFGEKASSKVAAN